jgi:hypothetical protein
MPPDMPSIKFGLREKGWLNRRPSSRRPWSKTRRQAKLVSAGHGGKQIPFVDVFFAQAGQPKHFSSLRKDDADFYIYHFADPQHARSFAAMFDGEIVSPKHR